MELRYTTSSDKYWKDRTYRAESMAEKTEAELLRDMKEVYQKSLKELNREIEAFYGRYAIENGLSLEEVHKRLDPRQLKSAQEEIKRYYDFAKPEKIGRNMSKEYRDELRRLSARAYMSRLEEIKMRLKHIVMELGVKEKQAYDKAMRQVYADAHAQTAYTIDKGLGFSEGYSAPNADALTKAVNEKWLGENYSDRVWKNKSVLLTAIEQELLSGIAQGHNPRKIAEAMADRYGLSYKNCERLARTECIHYYNQATADCYRDHGVEDYQFVCGLDERTCPECGALDGQVFDLKYKVEGVNYPVIHPNCYDEKTEVLTKDGWKLFRDCTLEDEYFSVNPNNFKKTAYMKAVKKISYLYSGTMLKLTYRNKWYGYETVSLRVTENHNMFLQTSKNIKVFKKNFHIFGKRKFYTAAKVHEDFTKDGLNFYFIAENGSRIHLNVCGVESRQKEMVYCVELPKWHTLLVRRNGSVPVWCGNCRCTTIPYFEKDDIDAMFEEAERVAYDEDHEIYEVPTSMTYKQWKETVSKED